MRLTGFFRPGDQAPYITATVIQGHLGIVGEVRFLVDSGASSTILSDLDVQRLGIDISRLVQSPEEMIGVGGVTKALLFPDVKLFFLTSGATFETDMEKIYVLRYSGTESAQKAMTRKIPSLLGRDFLNKYTVVLNYGDNLVLITDESIAI